MIAYFGLSIFWYFISIAACNRIDTTKIDMKSCIEVTSINHPNTSGINGDVYFIAFPNNDKSQLKTSQRFNMESDQLYDAEYDELKIGFTSCWKKISTITIILYNTNNREIISDTYDVTQDDYKSQWTSTSTTTQNYSISISMKIDSYCGGTEDEADGCSADNLNNEECDYEWSPECNVALCNWENGECRHENAFQQLNKTSCIQIEYVTYTPGFLVTTKYDSENDVVAWVYPNTVTDFNAYKENSYVEFRMDAKEARADINWHYCWDNQIPELMIRLFDASDKTREYPLASVDDYIEVQLSRRTNATSTFYGVWGDTAVLHFNTYTTCDINGMCSGEMLFNSQCDQQCNNAECAWDLTDCLAQPTNLQIENPSKHEFKSEHTATTQKPYQILQLLEALVFISVVLTIIILAYKYVGGRVRHMYKSYGYDDQQFDINDVVIHVQK